MTNLEGRLSDLGDVLDVIDGDDLADAVVVRLDEPERGRTGRSMLRVAAVLLVVGAVVVASVPNSRRTVAGWFGFDGVTIERRPDLSVPTVPDAIDSTGRDAVGTIESVDGVEILVSEFAGSLEGPVIGKIATAETDVTEVEVVGARGLWIDGAPHEVSFFDESGDILLVAVAGNTLLWQDGDRIRRLEGFTDVEPAVAYAEQLTDD